MLRLSLASAVLLAAVPVCQVPSRQGAALTAALGVEPLAVCTLDLPVGAPASFSVLLPLEGAECAVELQRRPVRAADFAVVVQGDDGRLVEVEVPPSATYRGLVRGDDGWAVSAALGEGGFFATLARGEDRFVVQPVRSLGDAGAPAGAHVVYRSQGLPLDACGVHADGVATVTGPVTAAVGVGDLVVCEIAFDCDVEFFQTKGSSVATVVADIERTMNAVNAVYERDVSITHRLTRVVVRTAEPDPYSGNDAGVILGTQFRGEWNSTLAGVPRDVAHFVTSRRMGNILGLAYVGGICTRNTSYALSRFRTTFDGNVNVVCHEIGHNWNCPHCLDPCDVMCGCGAQSGFGPNNQARIAAYRASRTCLDPLLPMLGAHYRLDEPFGVLAFDSGPNARNGLFLRGAHGGVPGAAAGTSTAAEFDGVDDLVQIADGPGLTGLIDGVSVAVWVRPDVLSGSASFVSNGASWSFGHTGDRLVFSAHGVGDALSTARLTPGRWTHVALTFARARDAVFFVDGVRVDAVPAPTPGATGPVWFLGARDASGGCFDGGLDDLQIYDGVMSEPQVAWLFSQPGCTSCMPRVESYGAGHPGELGEPSLSTAGYPLLGRQIPLVLTGSSSFVTFGVLVLGPIEAALPLQGGTLLIDPTTAVTVVRSVGSRPSNFGLPVPNDPSLTCATFHAQLVQIDPAAVGGLSFSPGLRLVLGG